MDTINPVYYPATKIQLKLSA